MKSQSVPSQSKRASPGQGIVDGVRRVTALQGAAAADELVTHAGRKPERPQLSYAHQTCGAVAATQVSYLVLVCTYPALETGPRLTHCPGSKCLGNICYLWEI